MTKKTGAELAVYALEQIGVRFTFGIPGIHNTEIYDALNSSNTITPILVTHECGGAFMADAVSRTSDTIGTLAIVPAAGLTHALSGIGEAFLDGVPMLIISGGIRRDTGRAYQVHDMDQITLAKTITKHAALVMEHEDVVPMIFAAYDVAISGEPGPALIEIPANISLFAKDVGPLPVYHRLAPVAFDACEDVQRAITLLRNAKHPGIFVGWGARDATDELIALADILAAPVATTLQGLSVFPANHPLHVGMGFGPSAVPAARLAFSGCDVLLAVGTRFSEIATGSYGMPVPKHLIHADINPKVFHKNYPATVALNGDAKTILRALLEEIRGSAWTSSLDAVALKKLIQDHKREFHDEWTRAENQQAVSPGHFFRHLREHLAAESFVVVDDGNHTYLTAEQFPVVRSKHFIAPTDFNCMGYAVPAAIGVKLTHPQDQVVAIVGDGAFLMTGLELLTAATYNLGIVVFVFHDSELAQISQFQQIPLNRKTCTILGDIKLEGVAMATGAAFLVMNNDFDITKVIGNALIIAAKGQPVVVDVRIDYSKKTVFTKGVVKVNLSRFPLGEKVRFIGRAIRRHVFG